MYSRSPSTFSTDSDDSLHPYDPESSQMSRDSFFYPSNLIVNSISAAIQGGNIDRAIELINAGKELNLTDNRGFTALHVAVKTQNLKLLDLLLEQPTINRDARSHRGETPLLVSLVENLDDTVILKLIEYDCDIHIPNLENVTPLSLAVKRATIDVAHLLIQKGADVDVKDFDGYTPLHEAVAAANYEAVCMLLYYNASVNEAICYGKATPFMMAVAFNRDNRIADLLFDYVTDFNATDFNGRSTLFLALTAHSPLSKRIMLQLENVNDVVDIFECLYLVSALREASMFKYIFSKKSFMMETTFSLKKFMCTCQFDSTEFVECLFLILSSDHSFWLYEGGILLCLVEKFVSYQITESDRLALIYLLYASVNFIEYSEFRELYVHFGYKKEVEAILVTKPQLRNDCVIISSIMAYIIFNSLSYAEAEALIWVHSWEIISDVRCLLEYLKFFSLSYRYKVTYIQMFNGEYPQSKIIMPHLNNRCIASLVELSRNKIRDAIIYNNRSNVNMYEIYEIVKSLPIPKLLKDILNLKRHLYEI